MLGAGGAACTGQPYRPSHKTSIAGRFCLLPLTLLPTPCLWVSGTLSSSQSVFPTHYSRLLLPTALWPHDADHQLPLDPFLALHLTLPWVISSWRPSRVIVYSPYFMVSGPTGLLSECPIKRPSCPAPSLLPGETVRFSGIFSFRSWSEQNSHSQAGGFLCSLQWVSVLPYRHPGSPDRGGHFGPSLFFSDISFPVLTSFLSLHYEKRAETRRDCPQPVI